MNDNVQRLTRISLNNLGKKFSSRWIFRNISFNINAGDRIAVTGPNGSGKSTLLQVIAGYITPSEGAVTWEKNNGKASEIFRHIAIAAPYIDLIDEFTLLENAIFFARFKPLAGNMKPEDLIKITGLDSSAERQLRYFSSGMKQRVKLAFAMMADAELLLLDEPLSNLDDQGYEWYSNLIAGLDPSRTVIICSNRVKEETFFCSHSLNMEAYGV